tara:strand:+ start:4368 stop:5471 length:1104 start_codon:yes stop_codon:yes gene_type:complete
MQSVEFPFTVDNASWAMLVGLGVSVIIAFVAHLAALGIIRRVSRKTGTFSDDVLIAAIFQPTRWLLMLLVVMAGMQAFPLNPHIEKWWTIGSAMALAALSGWLALRVVGALKNIVESSVDLMAADNLMARRRTTRVRILNRIAQVTIIFLTVAFMLLAIPSVRAVGVTLVASAGLAALAVGAAAQPALKNLIAGIQMAFTEPIRLDDVVIVEGEWGRIEDIRLTYVVVNIWDERRLVVPVSYFLEKPFQNWTRETSNLLGTVYIYVDHAADIGLIREAFVAAVKANERWDGRVASLQVTNHRADATELRGLLSARDAGVAWDLRCDVREAMMDFLREEMPEALVRERVRLDRIPASRTGEGEPQGAV